MTQSKSLPAGFLIQTVRWGWRSLWHVMMSQLAPSQSDGSYQRPPSQFRQQLPASASILDSQEQPRYRLIVGMSCPWAHRTLVVRALKGLHQSIPIITVVPSPKAGGWVFQESFWGCQMLSQMYALARPGYQGRSTVPVLWDQVEKTIVNNESADIIQILNADFNAVAEQPTLNLYPAELAAQIDEWNDRIYTAINNGVYRCGFAQTQLAYAEACQQLFSQLDAIDNCLARQRYLCGDRLTLADIRLFTTLIRFDVAYYGLFKCNRKRISDYKNLSAYLRDIYQLPGVAETCDFEQVKADYYGNLFPLNPGGLIPLGPDLDDLNTPHERHLLGLEMGS